MSGDVRLLGERIWMPLQASPLQQASGQSEPGAPDVQGELRGADMSHGRDSGPVKRSIFPVPHQGTLLFIFSPSPDNCIRGGFLGYLGVIAEAQ